MCLTSVVYFSIDNTTIYDDRLVCNIHQGYIVVHCVLYIVQHTLYNVHCTMYIVQCNIKHI